MHKLIFSADEAAWAWIKRLRLRPDVSPQAGEWLAQACSVGRADWVADLLEWGASPNAPIYDLWIRSLPNNMRIRPLAIAVGLGDRECVQVLLKAGANPNHVASLAGSEYAFGLDWICLDYDPSESRFTPLMLAEISGNKEIGADLISHGADPELTRRLGLGFMDYNKFRVLRDPVRLRYRSTIHALQRGASLDEIAAKIEVLPKLKWRLLIEACERGRVDVLKHLIELGIMGTFTDMRDCETPLHTLTAGGDEIVALLLANQYRRACSRIPSPTTLLTELCGIGDDVLVRKVLEAGYPPNWASLNFYTGANEEITPLMQAVRVGATACVEALIEHGANVNLGVPMSFSGPTCFGAFILSGNIPFWWNEVEVVTEYLITPLTLAEAVDNQSAIKLLREHGAKE